MCLCSALFRGITCEGESFHLQTEEWRDAKWAYIWLYPLSYISHVGAFQRSSFGPIEFARWRLESSNSNRTCIRLFGKWVRAPSPKRRLEAWNSFRTFGPVFRIKKAPSPAHASSRLFSWRNNWPDYIERAVEIEPTLAQNIFRYKHNSSRLIQLSSNLAVANYNNCSLPVHKYQSPFYEFIMQIGFCLIVSSLWQ